MPTRMPRSLSKPLIAAALSLAALVATGCAFAPDSSTQAPAHASLAELAAAPHRSPGNVVGARAPPPGEVVELLGGRPARTVVEIGVL